MIPISKPWLGVEEHEALRRPIESGWVAQGPEVAAFERELAGALGAEYACATSSGTTALFLALKALDIGPGDEVVTVSYSFIATANVIRHVGAQPVFVDIDGESFNMDPDLVKRVITPATKAILCAHQLGMPCDMAQLSAIASESDIALIEDAACAVGSEIDVDGRWERIGRPQGRIACFSFHPRKVLTTGEGGMVTTADPALDERCRSLRQHARGVSGPDCSEPGYNFRMSDLQAAVGRVQLARLDEIVARRRELATRYGELLKMIEGVTIPSEPSWARTNWQSYSLRLPLGVSQKRVISTMAEEGVAVLGGLECAHQSLAYQREPWSCGREREECHCPKERCERLVRSEEAHEQCLLLPLYHELSPTDQEQVVAALERALSL